MQMMNDELCHITDTRSDRREQGKEEYRCAVMTENVDRMRVKRIIICLFLGYRQTPGCSWK